MVERIISMYITMMPVIIGGILNMVIVKQKWFKDRALPIDFYSNWKDGKRIFGNNKTYLGIFTMILSCILTYIIWGIICKNISIMQELNETYLIKENNIGNNIVFGALMGIAYMICELPNSFIKRRIDIPDGKTVDGLKGTIFFVVDQLDSMFGVILVLYAVSKITLIQYISYVLLGGITHIAVNLLLYKLKIRRNV